MERKERSERKNLIDFSVEQFQRPSSDSELRPAGIMLAVGIITEVPSVGTSLAFVCIGQESRGNN